MTIFSFLFECFSCVTNEVGQLTKKGGRVIVRANKEGISFFGFILSFGWFKRFETLFKTVDTYLFEAGRTFSRPERKNEDQREKTITNIKGGKNACVISKEYSRRL